MDAETVDPVMVKSVSSWMNQLIRTIKTCRLYDGNNPTVVRFREDLGLELRSLLERVGEMTLDVGTHALHFRGEKVFSPSSREDNIAAALHRDGIRGLTFLPGIEARELETFLDQLLLVTGPRQTEDDLVTLLWEANLSSIVLNTVPIEGDVDGGDGESDEETPSMPWPKGDSAAPGHTATAAPEVEPGRSDDWTSSDVGTDLEAAYSELVHVAASELQRFQEEWQSEQSADLLDATADLMERCLSTNITEEDLQEISRFLPRVLRESLGKGNWTTARRTLNHLRACHAWWSPDAFFDGLTGSSTVMTRRAAEALDTHGEEGVEAFLDVAREFGPPAVEWLMQILAESQQKRTRRPLARLIADLIKDDPARLKPWMTNDQWYVVRNVVHILGWIGGNEIVPLLRGAIDHHEMRVRREVVAALSQAHADLARPIYTEMLPMSEPPLFAAILHQLSLDPSPEVAKILEGLVKEDAFESRSDAERRAVFMALATRGNEVLGTLETELDRGGIFARGMDAHWQMVARCIARIGTSEALALLERGKRSHKGGLRKACSMALRSTEGQADAA